MKKIAIYFIKCYQKIPGSFHQNCKYIPTCSNYALEAFQKHGFIKGTYYTIKRLLKCNPLSKGGIDLVPERKKKS
ncbi:MAG: membrane protein insertion efficiency factor YidD [Tenericutes bacterium]|nr:membrane protein insertion efficiency factor YidD [Mycoplasmatota bacterium]